ncbi:hypothetical protein [Flavobacterium sp. UBA7682]|uniref:hypothetical protein n=1 Tax=Flavobacterium sp. UBA7682 TaxID=1946560 RepID=UPI0025BC81E0|nr:hypothetical protein [Flavobacterium sp. UBA7682]
MPMATIVDKQSGQLKFKLFPIKNVASFDHKRHVNYYTILVIAKGKGTGAVDFSEFIFLGKTLLFFYPFQQFVLRNCDDIEGYAIQFHHSLLAVPEKDFISSFGSLDFGDWYTHLNLSRVELSVFYNIIDKMYDDLQQCDEVVSNTLMSLLSGFLDKAFQVKFYKNMNSDQTTNLPSQLLFGVYIRELIEANFTTAYRPELYAQLCKTTVKKIESDCLLYFDKTLIQLLAERLILEANRLLYLTNDSMGQIADILGFKNERVFAEFFFESSQISPELFRSLVRGSSIDLPT